MGQKINALEIPPLLYKYNTILQESRNGDVGEELRKVKNKVVKSGHKAEVLEQR